MTILAYIAMLAFVLFAIALWDEVWLRYLRPLASEQYGWPDVPEDARIKPKHWIGAFVVLSLAIVVTHVGDAVFY